MHRLFGVDLDGQERFFLQSDNKDYLVDRGEEWVRLMFIRSYYVVSSKDEE